MKKIIILFFMCFITIFFIQASQSSHCLNNKQSSNQQQINVEILLLHAFHLDSSCETEKIFENESSRQEQTLAFAKSDYSCQSSNKSVGSYSAVDSQKSFTAEKKIHNEKYKEGNSCCVIA